MRNELALVVLAAALAACKGVQPTPETEPKALKDYTPTAGPTETLLMEWTEPFSNVEQPGTAVVTTQEDWEKLWKRIGKSEAPVADLQVYFAAAVFLGQRNTGGYSVRLLDPEVRDGKLVVRYVEKKPTGIVFQALTYPYAVRLYPKSGMEVVVEPAP